MLTELCDFLKNWFVVELCEGDFVIANGSITYADGKELPLQDGQYFYISGAIFNHGVYQYGAEETTLKDEEFNGTVRTMAIPPELVKLAEDIAAWRAKNESLDSAMMSPFNSESFGGYSYSKSGGNTANTANGGSWQSVFGNRLARYRKV